MGATQSPHPLKMMALRERPCKYENTVEPQNVEPANTLYTTFEYIASGFCSVLHIFIFRCIIVTIQESRMCRREIHDGIQSCCVIEMRFGNGQR